MLPIGPKRQLENPEQNSPKRHKSMQTERNYSFTLFSSLPTEVIALIFSQLSIQNLYDFERVCHSHCESTTGAWHHLRQKHSYVIDLSICPSTDHRTNYLLSTITHHYIQSLPKKLERQKKGKQKFRLACQKFPLFQSLVELTDLPKETTEIPPALYQKLEKDPFFKIIADIYQFAIEQFKGKKGKSKKIQQMKQKICLPFQSMIESQIERGATYINHLTIKIFWCYDLVAGDQHHTYDELLIHLSQKAYDKGDSSGFEQLKDFNRMQSKRHNSTHYVDFGDKTLFLASNISEECQKLINQFIKLDKPYLDKYKQKSTKSFYDYLLDIKEAEKSLWFLNVPDFFRKFSKIDIEQQQQIWKDLQGLVDEKDMPSDFLHAVFRMHLQQQNWIAADESLSHIVKKEVGLSPFMRWSAAKLKAQLNQWEQAEYFYDLITEKDYGLYCPLELELEKTACKNQLESFR